MNGKLSWMLMTLCLLVSSGCSQPEVRKGTDMHKAAEVYVGLGIGYMEEKQYEVSLDNFKKALAINPRLPSAHNGIAILYEKLGELDLADKHYRKAVQLDAKDARALNNYGTFLCRIGKYKESQQYFERAVSNPLYDQPASALKNAGICARKDNDTAKAEAYFRRSLEINPAYAPSLLQMAKLTYAADDYFRARAYVQRYLQIAEPTAETLWLAVRTERELGDANAEASYALLLRSRFPDSPQAQQLERADDGERNATW